MATMWAKAAGGNWSAAATWASTDGGVDSVGPPGAADNAFFSNLSGNVVVDAAVTCLDLDMTKGTGYTGTLSGSAAFSLTISGSANRKGTWTFTGTVTFNATATGKTITNNGLSYGGPVGFTGVGGGWQFQDAFTATSGNVSHAQGTVDTNGFAVTLSTFIEQSNIARTLTLGASAFTCVEWRGATFSGLTLNAGTSTVSIGNGPGLQMGQALTFNNLTYTAGQAGQLLTCTGGCTVSGNLTLTNSATKSAEVKLGSNITVNGTLKYLGNSATNRLCINSDVTGTARTITAAAIDAASNDCDFRDITGAGAAAPFATGSRLGNCLGNSGITFTAPATQTATGTASFTWSTHGWTSRVPLPQDDVVINNAFVAGRTITCDMPRMGNNITCTCTGSPTWAWTNGNEWFGSLTFAAGMVQSAAVGVTWRGRGASNLTNNGVAWVAVLSFDGFGGTLTNADAFNGTGTSSVHSLNSGTWDLNDFSFSTGNRLTFTAPFIMRGRSGTLTMTGTPSGNTIWIQNASTCFVRDTSTVKLTFTDSVKKSMSFAAGCSFNVLQLAGSGIWSLALNGAGFTAAKIQNDRAGSSIVFLNGATYTLDGTGLAVNGIAPVGGDQTFGRFFGVAGSNTHSTPDAAANRITGDHAGMVKICPASVANNAALFCKSNGGGNLAFEFIQNASGALNFKYTQGGTIRTDASTVTQASVGAAAGSDFWFGWSHTTADGVTKFWWSNDGSAWTQMGTNVAGTAGALTDFAQVVEVGGRGSAQIFEGRIYRAKLFNGIPPAFGGGASASPVVDYNPADYASGNTWVSGATAETWTINGDSIVNATNRNAISSATGAAFTLTKSGGGHVSCDYITVRNSTGTPAGSPDEAFFATHSTNGGGNTGWNFLGFNYTLALDAVLFQLSPQAATVTAQRYLALDVVQWTMTPQANGFTAQRRMALDAVQFSWAASDVSVLAQRSLALDPVLFTFTPQDVRFVDLFPDPRFRISGSRSRSIGGTRNRTVYLRGDS